MAAAGRWWRQQQQARIMIAGSSSRLAFLPLALLLLLLTAVSVAPAAATATTAGSRRGLAQLQPDDGDAVDGGGGGGVGDVGTRVVGGRVAPEERLSHQLAVLAGKDGRGLCGAALVAGHVALTAAHCMTSADLGSVVVGAYSRGIGGFKDGATAYLRRVLNHPAFKSKASTPDVNDAALLMLDRCPTLGAKVSVIAIASPAGAPILQRPPCCAASVCACVLVCMHIGHASCLKRQCHQPPFLLFPTLSLSSLQQSSRHQPPRTQTGSCRAGARRRPAPARTAPTACYHRNCSTA